MTRAHIRYHYRGNGLRQQGSDTFIPRGELHALFMVFAFSLQHNIDTCVCSVVTFSFMALRNDRRLRDITTPQIPWYKIKAHGRVNRRHTLMKYA